MSGDPTSLADVVTGAIDATLGKIHTSMPGKVVSYNSLAQTADVQPMCKRQLFTADGEKVYESLPLLPGVPVCFPRGGGYVVTFPLQAGDTVVLVFSEAGLAEFLETGSEAEPWDTRRHHISNAVAIPSISPDTAPLASGDNSARTAGIVIGKDGANEQIRFASGSIKLGADATDFVALASLVNTNLTSMRNFFNTHTHPTAGTGAPSFPTAPMPAPSSVAASLVKAK